MDAVGAYLRDKRVTLLNDYRTPDGKNGESCGVIALEVAERLRLASRDAYVVCFHEDEREAGGITSRTLRPTMFGGRVEWSAHMVACSDDVAYDPLCEGPVPLAEYARTVFGHDVAHAMQWSRAEIDAMLNDASA